MARPTWGQRAAAAVEDQGTSAALPLSLTYHVSDSDPETQALLIFWLIPSRLFMLFSVSDCGRLDGGLNIGNAPTDGMVMG